MYSPVAEILSLGCAAITIICLQNLFIFSDCMSVLMKHQLPILPAPGPGRLHSTFCLYEFDSEIGISHFSEHNVLKVHVTCCNASEFPSFFLFGSTARGLSLVVVSGGSSLVVVRGLLIVVRGLLIVVVSLIAEHGFQGLWCMGLVALWRVESSRTRD